MTTTYAHDHPKAPECQCCGGEGLHYIQMYAAGKSPFDTERACDTCGGSGLSFFIARANSCRAARSLRGGE